MNNQVDYPSFISNEFINLSKSIHVFFLCLNIFSKIFYSEGNITNFAHVFFRRFHLTHKNFAGYWTNTCRVIASVIPQFFFKNGIFINVKKNWKNSHGFWKINNSIRNEKRIGYLIIFGNFFSLFVNNFSASFLLCKKNVLGIFDMGDFIQIFVISRNTEILIESNFWLWMYVTYIHKKCIYFFNIFRK